MKQQHGRAELYRAGEPVFERSEFTGLDFFDGPPLRFVFVSRQK